MELIAFFHYFDNFKEFIEIIDSIALNYFGIAMGKFIILKDQISMKDGRTLGKKGEKSYILSTMYSDENKLKNFLKDGVIKEENFINIEDINDNEFDEFDNLKKADTLIDYGELLDYIKKNKLN